jgi:2-polyprenyl-6-methoxyphenol hydroxylase-like FAD-dependent oxidoreductase
MWIAIDPQQSISVTSAALTHAFPTSFLSQADTEAVLNEHLQSAGVTVERRVEPATFQEDASGLLCVLRHDDGLEEPVRVSYLVGCDGAHSTVRKGAGIPFEGGAWFIPASR